MSFAAKKAMASVKMKQDKMSTEEAGRKRGLWGSVGSGLGGLLAMGLTASMGPLGAGLYTGLASVAGGAIGSRALTSKKNKNILRGTHKGNVFFKDEAKDLRKKIDEDIIETGIKTGVKAGFATSVPTDGDGVDPKKFDLKKFGTTIDNIWGTLKDIDLGKINK